METLFLQAFKKQTPEPVVYGQLQDVSKQDRGGEAL